VIIRWHDCNNKWDTYKQRSRSSVVCRRVCLSHAYISQTKPNRAIVTVKDD